MSNEFELSPWDADFEHIAGCRCVACVLDQQIDDIHALLAEMAQHSRRKRAEKWLGPIKVYRTHNMTPCHAFDYEAFFDRYLDLGRAAWTFAHGPTEAEAIRNLLDGAEDEIAEREERKRMDEMRLDELERRSGC